eukprot:1009606_1
MSENQKEYKNARNALKGEHAKKNRNRKRKQKNQLKKLECDFNQSVSKKQKKDRGVKYNCNLCGMGVWEDQLIKHDNGAEHLYNRFGAAPLVCQACLMDLPSQEELWQHQHSATHLECVVKQKDLPNNNSYYWK